MRDIIKLNIYITFYYYDFVAEYAIIVNYNVFIRENTYR